MIEDKEIANEIRRIRKFHTALWERAEQLGIDLGELFGSPATYDAPNAIQEHVRALIPDAELGHKVRSSENTTNEQRRANAEHRRHLIVSTTDKILKDLEAKAEAKGRTKHGLKSLAFRLASSAINRQKSAMGRPAHEQESPDSVKKIYYRSKRNHQKEINQE